MKFKIGFMFLLLASNSQGAELTTNLPASVDPVRPSQQAADNDQRIFSPASPIIKNNNQKMMVQSVIPNADNINFFLKHIEISGNSIFTLKDLLPLFAGYLHHTVSLADIQKVTQAITLKYHAAGYVLSRAILPAQTVQNGNIRLQIIEGNIQQVNISSTQKNAGSPEILLKKYGSVLASGKPLKLQTLERYALLSNDIPGMEKVKTVLQAPNSKAAPAGAADLIFTPDFTKAFAFIGVDNRGSRYLGQNEFSAGGSINSLFRAGDQFGFQGLTTNREQDLQYINLFTLQPIGHDGATLTLSGSFSKTQPEYLLSALNIAGKSKELSATFQMPWIRTRAQSLYGSVIVDYLNTNTDIHLFDLRLYNDHIRSIRLESNYYYQDAWKGLNQLDLKISQGLSLFGASKKNQMALSRVNGNPQYTKENLTLSRLQGLTDKMSFYLSGIGQYTANPLLSSEEFTFGGSQFGQAYDFAEIAGDKGIAGKAELRYNASPGKAYLSNIQYFTFYDIGKTYNLQSINITGIPQQQSAASAGAGVRINFTPYLYGSGEFAKPLTRKVAVMKNRQMRYFISLNLTGKKKLETETNTA